MSENAKCPVCGERLTGDIDGVVICWSGCSFRCGGYALPRIAAAMELAKATAVYGNKWGYCEIKIESGDDDEDVDRINDCSKRVLEVFK